MFVPNFKILGQVSNMWLNFLYTVQLVISDVCTKFQNSRSSKQYVVEFSIHSTTGHI